MADHKYEMTMNLNVLHHLGIKLYSNVAAVLSEIVANSWDADAKNVDVEITEDRIVIVDDGCGMTVKDANEKYLLVGYDRRKDDGGTTKELNRPVMGRKGIGKLSLFSIADKIEVQSVKGGQKHGLRMSAKAIEKAIVKDNQKYYPEAIPDAEIQIKGKRGTRIILNDLKKRTRTAAQALKKRLARRFSIIGSEYDFSVKVNGEEVTIEDRDYFQKIQYLWCYGDGSDKYEAYCSKEKLKQVFKRDYELVVAEEGTKNREERYRVCGWIGSVTRSGHLKDGTDNLNKIVVMVRGKLAQEDILEDFPEGGLYTKYLIGEIHADFLDMDEKEDIATSNRQEIRKDDPRYVALREWVNGELKNIEASWTELRNKEGTETALENPAIKEWFESLKAKSREKAKQLFGKINQLTLDSEEQRKELFRYGVLAFESLRYKENLDKLDSLTPADIEAMKIVFADLDDIEATLYHQIVKQRLRVIETLQKHVDDNALEKVIQKHLYEHLWLLDPSWDRATETPMLEKQVNQEFKKLDAQLTLEEKKARYDIKYKNPSGKHIIIELKRANRTVSSFDLGKQIRKYMVALKKLLKANGRDGEPIEAVCLVGKPCNNWSDKETEREEREMLEKSKIRVILYQKLITDAYGSYEAFLNKKSEVGRIAETIRKI